jgi:hypothetical protein
VLDLPLRVVLVASRAWGRTEAAVDVALLIATVAGVASFLGFLLSRRYMPHDPHHVALICGFIVIISSAYTLATTDARALTFRVHIGLLVLMVIVLLYRGFRAQRL